MKDSREVKRFLLSNCVIKLLSYWRAMNDQR